MNDYTFPNNHSRQIFPRWLKWLMILFIAIGVFLRFLNLDIKAYWADEAITSMRISGYTLQEVKNQLYNGIIHNNNQVHKFQIFTSERGIGGAIYSLAQEDSQHPPVYYSIAHFWARIFGDSIWRIRVLSVLISILVFPVLFWLCYELFNSFQIGIIASALVSVAPSYFVYSQEAREYALWTVTTLILSASLLHSFKKKALIWWILYAVSIAIGLYTFPLTLLTLIGYTAFFLISEKCHVTQRLKTYFIASLSGILMFSPWLIVMLNRVNLIQDTTNWLSGRLPIQAMVKLWLINIGYSVVSAKPIIILIAILIIIVYSWYYIMSQDLKKEGAFILALILPTSFPLMLIDLTLGKLYSFTFRYSLVSYLGIHIALAYLFFKKIINGNPKNIFFPRIWSFILIIFLLLGVLTDIKYIQNEFGWNKGEIDSVAIAKAINQSANRPLVISNASFGISQVLSLSNYTNDKVDFLLLSDGKIEDNTNIEKSLSQLSQYDKIFIFSDKNLLDNRLNLGKYKLSKVLNGLFEPSLN